MIVIVMMAKVIVMFDEWFRLLRWGYLLKIFVTIKIQSRIVRYESLVKFRIIILIDCFINARNCRYRCRWWREYGLLNLWREREIEKKNKSINTENLPPYKNESREKSIQTSVGESDCSVELIFNNFGWIRSSCSRDECGRKRSSWFSKASLS